MKFTAKFTTILLLSIILQWIMEWGAINASVTASETYFSPILYDFELYTIGEFAIQMLYWVLSVSMAWDAAKSKDPLS